MSYCGALCGWIKVLCCGEGNIKVFVMKEQMVSSNFMPTFVLSVPSSSPLPLSLSPSLLFSLSLLLSFPPPPLPQVSNGFSSPPPS